jgi:type II secretory pathway component PulK
MTVPARTSRRGFALLAVLWIMVATATLALTITFAARESVAAARNRTSATRAMWRAHDCLERTRVAIGEALRETEGPSRGTRPPWSFLDSTVVRSEVAANLPCRVEIRAAGMALDVNAADAEVMERLFHAAGIAPARADSMTDALIDWRDTDDDARPLGAERAWYMNARRATPRNAALAAAREIAFVRGFDTTPGLDTLLSVEAARIVLPRAPLAVIAALPGMGDEALARVAERRLSEPAWPMDLLALSATLSPEARAVLFAHYAELARLTTVEPDAWTLTSRGRDGSSPVTAVIEARLVRAGTRAGIVRRRSWVE